MSTSIEWTDETWNPTGGCDRVSPGCARCYAKQEWDRRHKAHLAGKKMAAQYATPFEVVQMFPDRLLEPLSWRRPRRVFVNSVSDLFHEDVPDAFIDKVFTVMALAPQHTFQILTKRPERMRAYASMADKRSPGYREAMVSMAAELPGVNYGSPEWYRALDEAAHRGYPLPNVWLGVSVENQHFADERIPLLLQTPAAVRFISAEPLLGSVKLDPWLPWNFDTYPNVGPRLDWVIVGGESGPGARPFDLAWARSIVAQCQAAGVACFVKQLGANAVSRNDERDEGWPGSTVPIDDDYEPRYQGETAPLCFRDRKGGDITEFPADLQVREFPTVT